MSADNGDELTRILARHREHVAAARVAAEQRARSDEHVRHECEAPLREVALPLLREWSKRLSVEGYPTSVEGRLGCRAVGADSRTPLAELQTRVVLEGLGRFVTAALEATIPRRSDCGP